MLSVCVTCMAFYLSTCAIPVVYPPPPFSRGTLHTLPVLSVNIFIIYALPVLSSLSASLGPVTHLSPSPAPVIWSGTLNLLTSCHPFDSAACN